MSLLSLQSLYYFFAAALLFFSLIVCSVQFNCNSTKPLYNGLSNLLDLLSYFHLLSSIPPTDPGLEIRNMCETIGGSHDLYEGKRRRIECLDTLIVYQGSE
ncbi:PREDICTED: uncharacterized protein LOC104789614 [Camelina sativa]|uniref:Uncharacterized protein LOC104789614 n=1 Tax=Camelina sativa TaxID=90675 RepID=A0ABM0ZC35_CAMSA|nr:PREDICTED: uncharacterized protein LOC104789614 [Camelina sativa]